ncbi:MAG TPA: serine hydrolase domain-containing protein [Candidatus Paceibacterota bacterium]|jgi:CubicO group peptidase (beta-lactamase class C family)|nr:serine hydrolase domain-containing protein [Candidatus Paceibacterota bacterium]
MNIADKIEVCARRAIAEKTFPGCVIGVVRENGDRQVLPFGHFTYENDSPEVGEDTIYDLASVTKSIPVASLAAIFAAENKISLTDGVTKYIPELQNDFGATLEDLLRYRVRGPTMSELAKKFRTFEEVRTHVFERGFDGPPGESEYTNLPAFLLGIVLERAGGEILPALAQKYFFGPLAMNDTTFFPHDSARIAPTEIIEGREIRGVVHDESARMFAGERRAVGHAGLFSTAPDLLNFLDALLRRKFPVVVEAAESGLGWHVCQSWFMGDRSPKTFGKTGFTGTSVVVDIEKRTGLVVLSNRTYPGRPPDAGSIHAAVNSFRSRVADIVFRS